MIGLRIALLVAEFGILEGVADLDFAFHVVDDHVHVDHGLKISGRMKSLYFGASLAPRMEQAAFQIQDSRDLPLPLLLLVLFAISTHPFISQQNVSPPRRGVRGVRSRALA